MKFFCVVAMLFFSYANLFAQSLLEQRIDFSTKNKSLESTLYKLIDKKGINISFNPQILPKEQLVTIHAKNERIENILIQLFENSPLTYKVIGNQIVLYEKFIPLPVKKHTVSGYIEDESSGERLIGANVFEQNTSKGTSSNHFGFYSLTLEGGKAQIHFSYLGYESDIVDLDIGSDQILNISLKTALTLQEIIVTDADTAFREFRPVNVDQLSNSKIENTQRIGGESDIIRTTHFLPGVQTGTDGVGGIHVRGGGVGQNLVMIDDVPVYNISHGAGVFSIFNTSAIKSAQLYKGGFPARFGGRLSSVLEIRMKEGNKKKLSGKAELGMLTAKAMLEGPFKKDKSSFFVSFRQSLVNSYIVPLSENFKAERGEEGAMRYNFYDINAKLNHSFSQKDKIYFSLYKGRDDFTNNGSTEEDLVFSTPSSVELNYKLDQEYKEQFNWGNNISSFRWNHLFNNKLFSNTTLIYSKLDVGINYSSVDSLLRFVRVDQIFTDSQTVYKNIDLSRYRSSIEDKGVKIDFDYYPNAKHYLKFGTAYTRHTFLPGALSSDENSELFGEDQFLLREIANDKINTNEYYTYIEDEFKLGKKWNTNVGLHASGLKVEGKNYFSLQPRISTNYLLKPTVSIRASFSRMTQYLHLLSNSDIGIPTDLWVPVTEKIKPQEGWLVSTGVGYRISKSFRMDAELYYRSMKNLITYSEGVSFITNWQENITFGKGQSYGLEVILEKFTGKTKGWLAYTLSHSTRQFDNVNFGQGYPYKYDRRHSVKLVFNHRFSKWLTFNGSWMYSTGTSYSIPGEEYAYQVPGETNDPVTVFSINQKNQYRLPPYHRLDVGFNISIKRKWGDQAIYLGAFNLYNRKNPLYYGLRRDLLVNEEFVISEQKKYVQVWLMPFLPSVSYSVKF